MEIELEFSDLLFTPVFIFIMLGAGQVFANRRYANDPCRVYFIPALFLKLAGGLLVGIIYRNYYRGGDTRAYHRGAASLADFIIEHVEEGIEMLINRGGSNVVISNLVKYRYYIDFAGDPNSFIVVQVGSIFELISFRSYYSTSLFFSLFSFIGVWGLFRVYYHYFPTHLKSIAYGVLFIPTTLFWGSGILKDSLCLGGIGVLVYCIFKIAILNQHKPKFYFIAIICGNIVFNIKAYIILSLIPFITLWLAFELSHRIRSALLRFLFGPVIFLFISFFGYLILQSISEDAGRFSLDRIVSFSEVHRNDLLRGNYAAEDETGGSTFDIGDLKDDSFASYLSRFPAAVNATLFRPYPWESKNILMFISSLESLFFMYLTIRLLLQVGFWKAVRILRVNPFLFCMFLFSIVFAFAVGASTANFGALVRYKTPCIPFYMTTILLVFSIFKQEKTQNKMVRKLGGLLDSQQQKYYRRKFA